MSQFDLASVFADASAGMAFGGGSIFSAGAFADAHRTGPVGFHLPSGMSSATLSFDQLVEIVGSGAGGTLVGSYFIETHNFASHPMPLFPFDDASLEVIQGNTSLTCTPTTSDLCQSGSPFTIQFPFQFGVPFEISVSLSVQASTESHQDEESSASLQLFGFTDQNGHPLQLVLVTPEPGTFVVIAAIFAVLAAWKQRSAAKA